MSEDPGVEMVEVAVSLVSEKYRPQLQEDQRLSGEERLLWTWNAHWGAFSLPMTKIRKGRGIVEPTRHAALRAAAEVLGVPVQVGQPLAVVPEIAVSDRDYVVKRYRYHVFRAWADEEYPPEAWRLPDRSLWLAPYVAMSGLVEPFSRSACDVLGGLIERDVLKGRRQETVVVIVVLGKAPHRECLLRWNPRWGYALPATRKQPEDDPLQKAEQVLADELGLPAGVAALSAVRPEPLKTFGTALVREKPGCGAATDYHHWVFKATVPDNTSFHSDQPLHWATAAEIRDGAVGAPQSVASGPIPPGRISPTVFQILSELGCVPWV